METECCKSIQCHHSNFTVHEISELRKIYHTHNTEEEKSQYLLTLFKSFHTTSTTTTSWIIHQQSFAIVLNNKPVCPTRFILIFGISFQKMKHAAMNVTNPITLPPLPTSNVLSTTTTIAATITTLLREYFDTATTSAKVHKKPVQFLHGFCKREHFYEFFIKAQ